MRRGERNVFVAAGRGQQILVIDPDRGAAGQGPGESLSPDSEIVGNVADVGADRPSELGQLLGARCGREQLRVRTWELGDDRDRGVLGKRPGEAALSTRLSVKGCA